MCYHTEQRETTVTVVVSETSQAVAAASQTDEDIIIRLRRLDSSLALVIHQFLVHAIDIKRGNLIDKLVAKHVLSSDEREGIKKLKKSDDKVNGMVMMLRAKSAAEFDSFLAILSETGQQSVADVVRHALHTAGQQLGMPTLLLYTNATHKQRGNLNFNL